MDEKDLTRNTREHGRQIRHLNQIHKLSQVLQLPQINTLSRTQTDPQKPREESPITQDMAYT